MTIKVSRRQKRAKKITFGQIIGHFIFFAGFFGHNVFIVIKSKHHHHGLLAFTPLGCLHGILPFSGSHEIDDYVRMISSAIYQIIENDHSNSFNENCVYPDSPNDHKNVCRTTTSLTQTP